MKPNRAIIPWLLFLAACSSPSPLAPAQATQGAPEPTATFAALPQQPLAPTRAAKATSAPTTQDYITFSINTQDFAYPEQSIAILNKIIALHEQHQIPVDIFLTDTMVSLYEKQSPDLLTRLKTSPMVAVSYHVRPPKPYFHDYDWLGIERMSASQQHSMIKNYETHRVDLTTGQATKDAGGYEYLAQVLGYPPYISSALAEGELAQSVFGVFKEFGAQMFVVHERATNIGETRYGLYVKPEHFDLKLFEHQGERAQTIIENALAEAQRAQGARAPYFVGVKMHDNDFFAENSAWLTVYGGRNKRPPWNTTVQADLLSASDQTAMWTLYESTVAYVVALRARVTAVNAPQMLAMEKGGTVSAPASPTSPALARATPTATPASGATTPQLYVSGTMHIETKRDHWPQPDALIAFFKRATATGMQWSIGADMGWLEGEPRAAEIIRATEALGVEWDIHAHQMSDRAKCYATISQLGGHPNNVISGSQVSEIDALRNPLAYNGTTFQPKIIWGGTLRPDHSVGSEDFSFGVWRPKSSSEWKTHDPNGNLITVGGGTRMLAGAEDFAKALAANPSRYAPVTSATIMVAPSSLTVVDTASKGLSVSHNGIDAIEASAKRLSAIANVRFATISKTADAWVAAGGIPSRTDAP